MAMTKIPVDLGPVQETLLIIPLLGLAVGCSYLDCHRLEYVL
jgi:hypothetical protein